MTTSTVRAPIGAVKPTLAFAALPHELRRDPRLNTRAIVLAAALLEYARSKPSCWPSNGRLARDMHCSERTVRYALASLQAAGWAIVRHDADNRTGRLIVLAWRVPADVAAPRPSVAGEGRKPIATEWEKGGEKEKPESDEGSGSPPPPAGREEDGRASAEDLQLWRSWAAGGNHVLAGIGRAALVEAGHLAELPADPPEVAAAEPDEVPVKVEWAGAMNQADPEPRVVPRATAEVAGPVGLAQVIRTAWSKAVFASGRGGAGAWRYLPASQRRVVELGFGLVVGEAMPGGDVVGREIGSR